MITNKLIYEMSRAIKVRRCYVRLSEEDYAEIAKRAALYTNGNISRYITQIATTGEVKVVTKEPRFSALAVPMFDFIQQYKKIGVNYNQVVHSINTMKLTEKSDIVINALDSLSERTDRLIEITQQVKKLFEEHRQEDSRHGH